MSKNVDVFTKSQILKSEKYQHNRDILSVVLHPDKSYSFDEIDKLINKYMKGSVK